MGFFSCYTTYASMLEVDSLDSDAYKNHFGICGVVLVYLLSFSSMGAG